MDKREQIEEMAHIISGAYETTLALSKAESLHAAGYRKVGPRPKVLGEDEIQIIRQQVRLKIAMVYHRIPAPFDYEEAVAQAQLEADIRWYEGVKDA